MVGFSYGKLREEYADLWGAMKIPAGRKVSRVELLRAGKDVPFQRVSDGIQFRIPSVLDYEVAAMYVS